MAERRNLRRWLLALAALATPALVAYGCSGEGASAAGTGEEPAPSTPIATPSSLAQPDVRPEQSDFDGGRGGLEFDPVSGRLIIPEAGPPEPKPFVAATSLPADPMPREDQVGVTFELGFRQRAVPVPPKSPEVAVAGLDEALRLTAATTGVVLTAPGRMKWTFKARALPLPFLAEIRARHDRFGNVVLWPGTERYRVVPAGALRTMLAEQRLDVTPLVVGTVEKGVARKVLDQPTRVITIESPHAKLHLDLATIPEVGLGGPLLCRALVEIAGVDPATPECRPEEVPLRASFDWVDGGGIELEVTNLERRTDLRPGDALVPPPGAEMAEDGLPTSPDGVYLTQPELAALRKGPAEIPRNPAAPVDGIMAENGRDYLMILWLDGIPVVAVPPFDKRYVLGPQRGHYVAQWRTFLGDRIEAPEMVSIPAVLRNFTPKSDADAGPPP